MINHSDCLHFADDLKVHCAIKLPSYCLLLESDTNCVHSWWLTNFMKLRLSKIRIISFTEKTNMLNYQYAPGNILTLGSDCIKDLGVHTDYKL
jgi:hypothetical protein